MQDDWILDVLTDLKSFAAANGMPALAEQLDDATIVAMAELVSRAEGGCGLGHDDIAGRVERYPGGAGCHQRA